MLGEPNINSPANIDASVMWRDRRAEFTKKVQGLVKKANSEVPPGGVLQIFLLFILKVWSRESLIPIRTLSNDLLVLQQPSSIFS